MKKTWYAAGTGLAGVALLASAFAVVQAQQKNPVAPPDPNRSRSKTTHRAADRGGPGPRPP